MDLIELGNIIIQLRKSHGYTRQRLSDELGIPYTTIRNYEKGEREPGQSFLLKISDKFNVTVDYLLGRSDYKTEEPNPPCKSQTMTLDEHTAKYHSLDHHGKEVVDTILNVEYERINSGEHPSEMQKTDGVPHRASGLDLITMQEEIEAELEAYRRELELERKGAGESSALPNTKHA